MCAVPSAWIAHAVANKDLPHPLLVRTFLALTCKTLPLNPFHALLFFRKTVVRYTQQNFTILTIFKFWRYEAHSRGGATASAMHSQSLFHLPKLKSYIPQMITPILPSPQSPGNHCSTFFLYASNCSRCLIKVLQYLSSWVWLMSLSVMSPSISRVVVCIRIFPFLRLYEIPLYICVRGYRY